MKTKSFISEDAIQRIASGNESSQTLISMDVLKNVLKPHQLRNVLGGSGWVTCYCICYDFDGEFYDFFGTCYGSKTDCESWKCPGINCNSPACM